MAGPSGQAMAGPSATVALSPPPEGLCSAEDDIAAEGGKCDHDDIILSQGLDRMLHMTVAESLGIALMAGRGEGGPD